MKLAEILPLTPVQDGLLYASTLVGDGPDPYTVQADIALTGDLDPGLLHRSAQAVFTRHPNLRTAFSRRKNGMPVALVLDGAEIGWAEHDLREDPDRWAAICDDARDERFDLARPPLLRLTLARIGERDWRLLITNHHLILDGWSAPLLLREIALTYAAGGSTAALPPVRPFRDYLTWLGEQDREAALDRWRPLLDGAEATLLAGPDPAGMGARPREVRLDDLGTLGERLADRARAAGVTLGSLVQTAWGLTLGYETGRTDVLFAATVSGRSPDFSGAESLIGMTIGAVPVRVRAAGADRVIDVAGRVQHDQSTVLTDHWVGLPAIAGAIGAGELADTLLVVENHPASSGPLREAFAATGLGLAGIAPRDSTHYPLTVQVVVTPHLEIRLHHLPAARGAARGAPVAGPLVSMREVLGARPDTPLAASAPPPTTGLALGAGPEREQPDLAGLLRDAGPYEPRVRALTAALRAAGAGTDAVVAVALPRGDDAAAAILATLRAGAAVLPIDLGYPRELVEYILGDAGPAVLVTTADAALPPVAAHRIVVDDLPDDADDHPHPAAPGSALAYLVYTSGSTGVPKGVAGTRDALATRIAWATALWPAAPGDARLLKSSFAFIDGLTELLGALAAGARLVIADDAERVDLAAQAALLRAEPVAQVTAVPSLAATLAATEPAACAGITRWVLSGEPLGADVAAAVRAVSPSARVVNSYGSSEVAGDVTVAELDADGVPVTLGRPVPGSTVRVLDPLLRPSPPGVVGEIYVAGPQIARGYLGRSALTAERFVADPFGPGRLYRTGDLGRWRPGGLLEFHGRVDGQVTIRGHRVETVGVEAALRAIPGVTGAAVVTRPDATGASALWAYLTVAPGGPDRARITAALAARLPSYQVPAVVLLDALPTLPNGKVDRRALPDPAGLLAVADEAPRTPTEIGLAAAFAEVLGVERVGTGDDFFALGGHSLLATRLLHRITADRDLPLTVRSVFDHPTVAALAAEIDRHAADPAPSGPVPPGPRPDPLPATAAQRGVWAAEQLTRQAPGTAEASYNLPFAVSLRGLLDTAALAAACGHLADRHEALRTRLIAGDGGALVQVIAPPGTPVPFVVHDDPGGLAAARERPFDLAGELPLRVDVTRRGDASWTVQLTVHHIAADEWCAPQLFAELAEDYRAVVNGDAPAGPARLQYADAAGWQERSVDRPREREHHRAALAGIPDELALPYDRPRPETPTGRGGTVEFTLPGDLGTAVRALAARASATPFMVIHAAVVAVWARLSGSGDIVLGTPVAGRGHPDLDAVIGMFTNTVAVRTRVDDDPTVTELLARVRETDLAALEHQLMPFTEVVDAVDPPRRFGRNPLFQTMIQYRGPVPVPDFAGLDARVEPLAPAGAKFDLTVEFLERADSTALSARIEYARDLFDRPTVERIAGLLTAALAQMTADPRLRLRRLDLLGAADRRSLDAANATAHPVTPGADLTGLIAAAAAAHPTVTAVLADGETTTYADLLAASGRLAAQLAAAGAGVDDVVAVDLPRGTALSVALLAAHRVGAAYLPLDREHPPARRRFLLDDAAPAVLITDRADTGDEVPTLVVNARGICDRPVPAAGPPAPGSLPDRRAAYLIYTSGSTGTPKAVVVEHRAIVNRLCWMQDRYGLVPGERVLHKTPTGFDVSVWELFWPLIAGATVVMAEPDAHRDPARIAEILRRDAVTTVHFVPSMLRAFLAAAPDPTPPPEPVEGLRRILCSGEALTAPLRDGVAERFPDARLHNLYGPTEAAVDVTEIDVTGLTGPVVPIGRPVWNTGARVLGPALDERPIGVWGDLYLTGVQLARGYARRPGLSAAHFVASPFSPGERMYRTGDVARWTADGVLEYAGRSDAQLKLRGQRVEPGEIEHALLRTGALAQAVVVGHRTADGRTVLAAYGVASSGADGVEPADLLAAVADELPAHLVPATLTLLDALPVTANGKLDRAALPDSVISGAGEAVEGAAERVIAEVFGEVLRLPEGVSAARDDDFFALGGDSIVAITVVNRLRRRGLELSVREVFEARTVVGLAGLAREVAVSDPDGVAPITERTRPLPLTPIAAQLAARTGRWQSLAQSVTVALPHGIGVDRLTAVLDAVLARHEALRLRVGVAAGGVWSPTPRAVADCRAADLLSVHQVTADPGEAEFASIADRVHARLDPTVDGCLQAGAVFAPDGAWLVLVIHHLAIDAVSWRLLLDDLAVADAALTAGRRAALGAPLTGFADYADAVAALAAAPETTADAARWRTLLASASPLFPAAAGPAVTQADLRTRTLRLPAETPTAPSFVAAVADALDRWRAGHTSGDAAPFLVDVEGHGRDLVDADLSETVGWLTALWPVRCDPAASDGRDRIEEQLAEPGYGYGLARYCNPRTARLLARSPRAQVLVNFLGVLDLGAEQPWRPAPQSRWTRTTPAADLEVDHPLTVDGRVEVATDGAQTLVVELTWSCTVLTDGDVDAIAAHLGAALPAPA
ncbi:non-ribosomal peptide synthetase [Gordonia sp. (in: high G+C Gram-positive bacteria)]|uniref:non-ribosomal peptide synthetase n=1 Tax=Gordonia sp. (in: high G+C Gram-positive bacteria) TaxID=84139 RepID=UPI0026358307|nr:non-ribosomal peptide synthetase [Gordonia sp. (in: high G+C Gram-positive bacteria)]